LTKQQYAYLRKLRKETGESLGHFVREAIEAHAQARGGYDANPKSGPSRE
jgi:hypothetical protein